MRWLIGLLTFVEIMLSPFCARADAVPERVTFPSADGHTTLTGYLFAPASRCCADASGGHDAWPCGCLFDERKRSL